MPRRRTEEVSVEIDVLDGPLLLAQFEVELEEVVLEPYSCGLGRGAAFEGHGRLMYATVVGQRKLLPGLALAREEIVFYMGEEALTALENQVAESTAARFPDACYG